MSEKHRPFVILSAILVVTLAAVGCAYVWLEDYAAQRAVAVAQAEEARKTAEDAQAQLAEEVVEEEPLPDWAGTQGADDALVESLEVQPANTGLLGSKGIDESSVAASAQVEVGEGLKAGSRWWVIAVATNDGAWRVFLTDAVESGSGTVMELPVDDPWSKVDWADDTLVRGQSALKRAYMALYQG